MGACGQATAGLGAARFEASSSGPEINAYIMYKTLFTATSSGNCYDNIHI